jgi:hypothetical protein
MPTDVEITDPQLSIYVPVPAAGPPGVCSSCHGAVNARADGTFYSTCWNCNSIPRYGVSVIAPISLIHTSESQLYAAARDYKSGAVDPAVRAAHSVLLAATMQRFLRLHRGCIAGAAGIEWDTLTIVPSTRGRPEPHPLEETIQRAPELAREYVRLLRPTGAPIQHANPNPDAFQADDEANGRRVLLLDDTFTSGANLHSAAAALSATGAHVVGAVPIGRVARQARRSAPTESQRGGAGSRDGGAGHGARSAARRPRCTRG